jgi:hypothetical protein
MTRLDVHSLGWIVTRDACAEIARILFGRPRRLSPAALAALGDCWRAVCASLRVDRRSRPDRLLIGRFATSLSMKSEQAVVDFVEQLIVCCPDLYSERALRTRCLSGFGQVITSLAFGTILACCASFDIAVVDDSAFVLFAIACWSLVTTIQLWRTHLLVKRISQYRGWPEHAQATQQSLAPHADGGSPKP